MGSKDRMIEATGRLLQQRGYFGTGLNEIVRASGAPKGSMYFHFPGGKEALAAAALERAAGSLEDELALVLDAAPSPDAAARMMVDVLGERLASSGFTLGCPVATVALEGGGDSPVVQAACSSAYRAWASRIEARLVKAGVADGRAKALASVVLAMIEGGLLLARAHRDVAPLRTVGLEIEALLKRESADDRHVRDRGDGADRTMARGGADGGGEERPRARPRRRRTR